MTTTITIDTQPSPTLPRRVSGKECFPNWERLGNLLIQGSYLSGKTFWINQIISDILENYYPLPKDNLIILDFNKTGDFDYFSQVATIIYDEEECIRTLANMNMDTTGLHKFIIAEEIANMNMYHPGSWLIVSLRAIRDHLVKVHVIASTSTTDSDFMPLELIAMFRTIVQLNEPILLVEEPV
jgi:hypothetical protein